MNYPVACFIIAIYELDNAVEICKNFLKFSNQSFIILHNNKNSQFSNATLQARLRDQIPESYRIHVNDIRLGMSTSQWPSPYSLYEIYKSCLSMALKLGKWKYAVFMQSNERLVRHGVDQYLADVNYDGGCFPTKLLSPDFTMHGDKYEIYKKIMPEYDNFYQTQTEGAYVSRLLAATICSKPDLEYDKINYKIYAAHEKAIPTIMRNFSNNIDDKGITYIDWDNEMAVTTIIIDNIRNGNMPGFFSVKRVNMDNIDIRLYILQKP